MTEILSVVPPPFPDHTQLPESDGTFVKNFQEHPQSLILTDSITSVLQSLHPAGQYAIGQDCGIYWRETDPQELGAEAPDWFYVPDVPPLLLDGQIRRSYVLWREFITPVIALEFASGDGSEERDTTALSQIVGKKNQKPGKFWVYERIMRIPYYGIYGVSDGSLQVYHLSDTVYQPMRPNERGHYPILPMQVELGVWQGVYQNYPVQRWLRWWDLDGNLLLTGKESADIERQRVTEAQLQALQERQRATEAQLQALQEHKKREQLVEQLKALNPQQLQELGIDPLLLN